MILYILSQEKKKRGLTTTQIYKRGKEIFREVFPKNKITVLRYLNTMRGYLVDKEKRYWFLLEDYQLEKEGSTKISVGEFIAKFDINGIQQHLNHEKIFHGIFLLDDIVIYGLHPYVRKYCLHPDVKEIYGNKIDEITENLKRVYDEIRALNNGAIIFKGVISKYEKNYSVYSKYFGSERDVECLKFSRNLLNILRYIVLVFAIKKLTEINPPYQLEEFVTNLDELVKEEIGLGGLEINTSMIKHYPRSIVSRSNKFFLLLLAVKPNNEMPYLLYTYSNGEIGIHPLYLAPLAEIMKKFFYRKRDSKKIKDRLAEIRFTGEIYELLYKDIRDILEMLLWMDYTNRYPPIIVINPLKKNIKKEVRKRFAEEIINFLSGKI